MQIPPLGNCEINISAVVTKIAHSLNFLSCLFIANKRCCQPLETLRLELPCPWQDARCCFPAHGIPWGQRYFACVCCASLCQLLAVLAVLLCSSIVRNQNRGHFPLRSSPQVLVAILFLARIIWIVAFWWDLSCAQHLLKVFYWGIAGQCDGWFWEALSVAVFPSSKLMKTHSSPAISTNALNLWLAMRQPYCRWYSSKALIPSAPLYWAFKKNFSCVSEQQHSNTFPPCTSQPSPLPCLCFSCFKKRKSGVTKASTEWQGCSFVFTSVSQ